MSDHSPRLSARLGAAAGLLIAATPAFYLLHVYSVPRRIILGFGILCWMVGVLVKWIVYTFAVTRYLQPRLSSVSIAVTQGALSASSELGATLVFFLLLPHLTLLQAIGMGAGAALVEGIITATVNLSTGTPYAQHVSDQERLANEDVATTPFLCIADRLVATTAHICSRTLLFVSMQTGNPLPAVLAFVTFGAMDGVGYYALVTKWQFGKLAVGARLYALLAGFASAQLLALFAAV